MYVATINVPGYLPMDDDPPVFETAQEAWEYLRDGHAMSWNDVDVPGDADDMLPEPYLSQYRDVDDALRRHASGEWLVCDFERVGTVYGPTPGYQGDHDLGLAYSVTFVEDDEVDAGARDLPTGHRWATEDEMDRPDAIVVRRSVDRDGRPYTQGEADLAVPVN